MNELRVTSQTTLADLQTFADQVGDKAKIRGEKNADGSITLYASEKKSGLWHNLGHTRANRQEAAQDAIKTVLKAVGGENHDTAMASVLKQLPGSGTELLGDAFKNVVGAAAAARTNASQDARLSHDLAVHLATALADAGLGRLNPDQATALSVELGSLFARWADGQPANEQLGYKMNPSQIEGKLLAVMRSYVPSLATMGGEGGAKALAEIMKSAAETAVGRFGDRMNEDGSLTIGKQTYFKGANIASGSFGTVDIWSTKPESGQPAKQIAVKTPLMDQFDDAAEQLRKLAASENEITTHYTAVGGDIDSPPFGIVGLKGFVRTSDGGVMVAMELCAKGSADSVCRSLDAKVQRNELTPADLRLPRLTLIKDMVAALGHYHEVLGMTHLDVKGANFFVTEEGVAKLGDFGTGSAATSIDLRENPIDNPRWLAPEVIIGNADMKAAIAQFNKARDQQVTAMLAKLSADLPPEIKERDEGIIHSFFGKEKELFGQNASFNVTNKVDTWSLGMEIFHMFTGTFPVSLNDEAAFMRPIEIEANLDRFGRDKNSRIHLPAEKQAASGLSDAEWQQLDQLVSAMLHPDPTQRPSLAIVLTNPLFNLPGVGGPQARAVLANA